MDRPEPVAPLATIGYVPTAAPAGEPVLVRVTPVTWSPAARPELTSKAVVPRSALVPYVLVWSVAVMVIAALVMTSVTVSPVEL